IANAHAPTALALVQAGRIDELASYLASFVRELTAAGAGFFAIPAITPHICRSQLRAQIALPMLDVLDMTVERLTQRRLSRVALFGTRYTIDSKLFGVLDGFDVVRPGDDEVDDIHRIYLQLATQGQASADDIARLRELARTLEQRDRVEAI